MAASRLRFDCTPLRARSILALEATAKDGEAALEQAFVSNGPCLIDVRVDASRYPAQLQTPRGEPGRGDERQAASARMRPPCSFNNENVGDIIGRLSARKSRRGLWYWGVRIP